MIQGANFDKLHLKKESAPNFLCREEQSKESCISSSTNQSLDQARFPIEIFGENKESINGHMQIMFARDFHIGHFPQMIHFSYF
jgi:hypothetical protein